MDADAKKTALRMIPYGIYVLTAEAKDGKVAAATVNGCSGRRTRRGCKGGVSAPLVASRNVGHGVSPGRAQRPARRK
jgi:hypothetical protein